MEIVLDVVHLQFINQKDWAADAGHEVEDGYEESKDYVEEETSKVSKSIKSSMKGAKPAEQADDFPDPTAEEEIQQEDVAAKKKRLQVNSIFNTHAF